MKKILYIIFTNLLILFIIFSALTLYLKRNTANNFFINQKIYNNEIENISTNYPTEDDKDVKHLLNNENLYKKYCGESRTEINFDSSNNAIIILGCSYAYGHGLKFEDSFGYLLASLTNRPVLNFSYCGGNAFVGISDLENLLASPLDTVYKQKISNSDYVIYVYMYDHINRYLSADFVIDHYEELFHPDKFQSLLLKIYLYRYILSYEKINYILNDYPSSTLAQNYLKSVLNLLYSDIKKDVPSAKVIFVIYDEKISKNTDNNKIKFVFDIINSPVWDEFARENDVEIIRTKDVMGFYFDKNYKLKEDIADWHPNARAWKEFTPIFVKEYIK